MKDNFSQHSKAYSQFRPGYPPELITYLASIANGHECMWDCGTGNGQLAVALSGHFQKVYATDLSKNQIANARQKENVIYKVENAEKSGFSDRQFDLITVAQAIHWFNFDAFYSEVNRTLKADGAFAVTGYALLKVDADTDRVVQRLYSDILGGYWDKERRYIDELYQTIPFPFREEKAPDFKSEYQWTSEQLTGYLETWSAMRHYIRENGENPVDLVRDELKESWGNREKKKVTFPMMLRVGMI
ncbi:class I SAM-dependent methyltransferase [Sinomicrobium weinanense]|uniref:Class I SAM-dependent methyltransferase n=1 Tax=Sinomicrobium weinanense TaxID=2842200 RepID=A0A926JR96_9FLAO|nr:class I SAM-dependent methyltransferase [Sinomicrobium weinanense]MBC9796040.1 class I SAM-dependent methyltransferase [Sinomicrobium weinanense]MBU3123141.1 class I SAM-dependent methyltransferase [Sinomicrobium weinanense]